MEVNIKKIFGAKRGENGAIPWITGLLYLQDGRILLADGNNPWILVYDDEGNPLSNIPLPGKPRDLALVGDNQIGVTLPEELMIQMINLNTLKSSKWIHVGYECFGITFFDDHFVVACGTHLATISKDGELLHTIKVRGRAARYICADSSGKLFYTGWDCDVIHSISPTGVYSIYKPSTCLRYCRGITCGVDGSLCVVGRWSHSVCMINIHDDSDQNLLTKDDGLDFPVAIGFAHHKQNVFLISNNDGKSVMICEICEEDSTDSGEKILTQDNVEQKELSNGILEEEIASNTSLEEKHFPEENLEKKELSDENLEETDLPNEKELTQINEQ